MLICAVYLIKIGHLVICQFLHFLQVLSDHVRHLNTGAVRRLLAHHVLLLDVLVQWVNRLTFNVEILQLHLGLTRVRAVFIKKLTLALIIWLRRTLALLVLVFCGNERFCFVLFKFKVVVLLRAQLVLAFGMLSLRVLLGASLKLWLLRLLLS